jgi:hypothetical protein
MWSASWARSPPPSEGPARRGARRPPLCARRARSSGGRSPRRASPRAPRCAPRSCEHAFVSIKGSPYARFRRALETGNALLARTAAAELAYIGLEDALGLVIVFAHDDFDRFGRAAAAGRPGSALSTRGSASRRLSSCSARWRRSAVRRRLPAQRASLSSASAILFREPPSVSGGCSSSQRGIGRPRITPARRRPIGQNGHCDSIRRNERRIARDGHRPGYGVRR